MSTKEQRELVNPFSMSDEDVLNMPIPTEEEYSDEPDEYDDSDDLENTEDYDNDDSDDDDSEEDEEDVENEDEDELDEEEDSEDDEEPQESNENKSEEDKDEDSDEELKETASKQTKDKKEKVDKPLDYEAEYNKLKVVLEPFKANGRDIQVDNVDQAITLMQKGIGYNAKMAALKPSLKILKMLENHSLLDENKINWLIDLSKKDPKAVNQLIKDSGIDPLEVDVEAETGYKPNSYQVTDKEIDVEQVLDEIKETPTYTETVRIIGEQWDATSRQALIKNPANIKHINDQVASGVYKQIMAKVDHYRALGELQGFSDYDAYCAVGTYMTQNGLFNGQTGGQEPTLNQGNQISNSRAVPDQSNNTRQNSKLKSRKKAASSTSSVKSNKGGLKVNPLGIPDEEFEKLEMPNM